MQETNRNGNPKAMVAVAAFAAFLATFNETYLNVAFAPIMVDFGIDVNTVQWLATGYMLGAAVMVPVSAFAFKSIRTRPLFCATTLLLIAGSIVGALAQSFEMLLVGRIVQALGTGMMIPVGMNITLMSAPREKLGTYMGIMGAMTTLGPSLSVLVAGALLAALPWNALLWTFAALSALCCLAGGLALRDIAELTHPKLDAPSVALIGLALVGILYGVSSAFGGSLVVAGCAVVFGGLFLAIFIRRQKAIPEPLIDLRPLGVPSFAMGVIANMLSLLTIFAMNILVPVFLQSVLGADSLAASLALFPAIMMSCIVSPIAGRIYDKTGPRVLLPLGFVLIASFTIAVSAVMATGSIVAIAILYIPVICGSALVIGPVQSLALSKLPPEQNPHGVTIMSVGFQIAGCIGSSVFMGVYGAVLGEQLVSGASLFGAATKGFMAAGALVAACAVAGVAIAVALVRRGKKTTVEGKGVLETGRTPNVVLADIMKRDVYVLAPTDTVETALALFAKKGISGVPVVQGEVPVGFISDGDIMRCLADQVPAFKNAYSFIVEQGNRDFDSVVKNALALPVGEVCAHRVISVLATDDLGEVCRVLAEHHLKKAPVLENGKIVGIINRSNITKYAVGSYLGSAR